MSSGTSPNVQQQLQMGTHIYISAARTSDSFINVSRHLFSCGPSIQLFRIPWTSFAQYRFNDYNFAPARECRIKGGMKAWRSRVRLYLPQAACHFSETLEKHTSFSRRFLGKMESTPETKTSQPSWGHVTDDQQVRTRTPTSVGSTEQRQSEPPAKRRKEGRERSRVSRACDRCKKYVFCLFLSLV